MSEWKGGQMLDEEQLKQVAIPYLENCRAGDLNHALRVVKWIKFLGEGREDLSLLITAGYIHDIGWSGVLPEGKLDFNTMLQYEDTANANSSRMIEEVLTKLNFSPGEVSIVKRLVSSADKHSSESEDEAIIVDADSLSKLCIEHLQEKYLPDSYQSLIDLWEKEFPNRTKTAKARNLYPDLLANLKKDILN